MLIGALLLAAALPAQSVSPQSGERDRDICAIYALPQRPGVDSMGDPEASRRVREITFKGWSTVFAGTVTGDVRCDGPMGIDELRFSPDGLLAFSSGGWQSGPLAGSWGDCYYEKKGGKWQALTLFHHRHFLKP